MRSRFVGILGVLHRGINQINGVRSKSTGTCASTNNAACSQPLGGVHWLAAITYGLDLQTVADGSMPLLRIADLAANMIERARTNT